MDVHLVHRLENICFLALVSDLSRIAVRRTMLDTSGRRLGEESDEGND